MGQTQSQRMLFHGVACWSAVDPFTLSLLTTSTVMWAPKNGIASAVIVSLLLVRPCLQQTQWHLEAKVEKVLLPVAERVPLLMQVGHGLWYRPGWEDALSDAKGCALSLSCRAMGGL
uniref:Uncharacterized protein n=1 Tax=Octactis speculum TaxID=3111310 RepID=A0A7S2CFW2_9STRA